MFNKVYSKVISFIKENLLFIIILFALYLFINVPLPYYIHTTGGLINISDKVKITHETKKKGTLNLAYVTEIRGNILTYLMSYVIPNWDLVSASQVSYKNETYQETDFRNKMLLEDANDNAIYLAYTKAHKYINISDQHNYVIYIDEKAKTNLSIGDEILSLNDIDIININSYIDTVQKYNIGDHLTIKAKDENGKVVSRYIDVYEYKKKKITGIYFVTKYNFVTDPKLEMHFKESESGPSGGLMMTLAIYNKLIKEDITKGKTIVGTGTIDRSGNVGEISGIEYKLEGAIKGHADIFLTPTGNNYKEALALKKKKHYNIEIVEVSTFDDTLRYLESL